MWRLSYRSYAITVARTIKCLNVLGHMSKWGKAFSLLCFFSSTSLFSHSFRVSDNWTIITQSSHYWRDNSSLTASIVRFQYFHSLQELKKQNKNQLQLNPCLGVRGINWSAAMIQAVRAHSTQSKIVLCILTLGKLDFCSVSFFCSLLGLRQDSGSQII